VSSTWPENWKDLPLVVLDVETTGFDPEQDRIIEIALIRFEGGEVIETYGQLINPEREVPAEVVKLTGIKSEELVDQPLFADVAKTIWDKLQGVGIVAYNLSFDRGFIRKELERVGLAWPDDAPTLDPLIFARQFFKNSPRKNLGTVSKLLGIPLEEAHRATHDATVTGHILYAFESRLPAGLQDLLTLQTQWEAAQASETQHWKSGGTGFSLGGGQSETPIGLGPAYIYGDEADPLRALFMSVPEAREG
jgi:DNA polymerase III subunit epsilon